MKLLTDSPFAAGWIPCTVKPPQSSLLVVVKATYDVIGPDALADATDPALPTGDAYFDDEPEGSLLYASDFAPWKPAGECFVVGSAHAAGGQAVPQLTCALKLGPIQKEVRVTGDRRFTDALGGVGPAEPFTRLPLSWERSFGHPGHPENPVGRGARDEDGRGARLPNLEDPARPMRAIDDRPPPHGLGPIAPMWPARFRYAGTYDAAWQRERWPWLPADFAWEHYLVAPPDQRAQGYWRGDEEVALTNLHPNFPRVRARLPGVLPRAFLKRPGVDALADVPLTLDTVVVDSDAGRILLVSRGLVDVEPADLASIEHVFVTTQRLGAGLSPAECERRYRRSLALDADPAAEDAAKDVVLPWERPAAPAVAAPAPAAASPAAIARPRPRLPPVTSATLPFKLNRSFICAPAPGPLPATAGRSS